MKSMLKHWQWGLAALVLGTSALAMQACGGSQEPQKKGDWMDSLKPVNPGAEPELGDEPDEPEPTASAQKPADKPKSPPIELHQPSGRIPVVMGPSKSISSTFGVTPGSVLKLTAEGGAITLKIPEYALDAGYNIEFKSAGSSVKPKGTPLGTVAVLTVVLGGKQDPKEVPTHGPDYEVRLPLLGKDSVNLAIGVVQPEDATKVTWTVQAPKSVDTGFGEANFALKSIGPVMYLHGTLAEATAPAAE